MPRFVGRPVIVEAHSFEGNVAFWPEPFRLAVRRHYPDGTIGVAVGSELRTAKYGDWVVHGPDGLFTVMTPAAFEAMFSPQAVPAPSPAPPAASPRRDSRRGSHV